MRSRQEIKAYARSAIAAQRGNSILVLFLAMVISGAVVGIFNIPIAISNIMHNPHIALLAVATLSSLILTFASLTILVLSVNLCGVFVKVFYGQSITIFEPFATLKVNFGRKLGGMLWMTLWIYLWMLLGVVTLFIPVIIKSLSYSMTPYILASNPNVSGTDALKLSKRMTKGHKGKIFVLYLSFIGWHLLNGLTLGILGIFYVYPYMETTVAGFFVELRNLAVASGVIHPVELDGSMPMYAHQPQYPPVSPYAQQPQYHPASPYAQPQYPPASPYAPSPQHPGAPPYVPGPQHPGAPPYAPGPQYPGAPPFAPGPQHPGAPPFAQGPQYPGGPQQAPAQSHLTLLPQEPPPTETPPMAPPEPPPMEPTSTEAPPTEQPPIPEQPPLPEPPAPPEPPPMEPVPEEPTPTEEPPANDEENN